MTDSDRPTLEAFSLVELSIVLVILGLLTGGILAGQSLIRASELRAVTSEYQRYVAATQTFRDKYLSIPGDMTNATRFWGRTANVATCVTNSSASVTSPGTCDGDGDGTLDMGAGASLSGERTQFWNQLAQAGLIEGSYSGYAGSGGVNHIVPGTNAPVSKLTNAGWSAWNSLGVVADGNTYSMDYGNSFFFGAATTTDKTQLAVIRPEDAWGIDSKLDDGKPGYGKVIAYFWNDTCATGGATNTDLANSVYKLTSASIACTLIFRTAF